MGSSRIVRQLVRILGGVAVSAVLLGAATVAPASAADSYGLRDASTSYSTDGHGVRR